MESTGRSGHARCMDDDAPDLPNEWLPRLRRARAALTVSDEVGLALRDHRRRLGMSQRTYAGTRGLSRAMLARLEAGAGRLSLDTVVKALEGTGFVLQVGFSPDHPSPPPVDDACALAVPGSDAAVPLPRPSAVPAEAWAPTDLVARVRGNTRRFPAHRTVEAVINPPLWWWMHEFFRGPSEEPKWYAPVSHLDLVNRMLGEDTSDEDASGAA